MDTTLNRLAVDVAPERSRPRLALVLALLAVPGSTIAWELPAGASGSACHWPSKPSCSVSAHAASSPAPEWRPPRS